MPGQIKYINILIINYNNYGYTIECLESVFKLILKDGYQLRVCVVDNSDNNYFDDSLIRWASGQLNEVYTEFPDVIYPVCSKPIYYKYVAEDKFGSDIDNCPYSLLILRQSRNCGFASANNFGIKYLLQFDDWEWVWLLNNDTVVNDKSFISFIDFIKGDLEKTGIVGTKLFYYTDRQRLQGIGGRYNKFFGNLRHVGCNEIDRNQFNNVVNYSQKVDYVIGASMFVNRDFITEVGFMEEEYFLFFEELDWTLRGRKLGWAISFLPDVHVYHRGGGSVNRELPVNKSSLLSDKCNVVNRIKVSKRFYPYTLPFIFLGLMVILVNRLLRGQTDRLLPIIKAIVTCNIFP